MFVCSFASSSMIIYSCSDLHKVGPLNDLLCLQSKRCKGIHFYFPMRRFFLKSHYLTLFSANKIDIKRNVKKKTQQNTVSLCIWHMNEHVNFTSRVNSSISTNSPNQVKVALMNLSIDRKAMTWTAIPATTLTELDAPADAASIMFL